MKKISLILTLCLISTIVGAQIIVIPSGGSGGGSSTTIINNITNTTSTPGSFISEGGQVVWLENYEYSVSAASFYINNTSYTSTEQTITLDAAHATLDRFDVIAVDDTGTIVKVTGTAAVDPSEPSIDPGSQIKLGLVLVTANTTEPVNASSTLIYLNNAGSPTEWDWTVSGTGFNVDSTNNPYTGATKSIEGTTVNPNAFAVGEIGMGSLDLTESVLLTIYIRSKATWTNNRGLQVGWYSDGVLKGQQVVINPSGTWGFTSSVTGTYQQVAIPISNFAVPASATVNQLRITKFGAGNNIGFYLGNITVQGGAVTLDTPILPTGCDDGNLIYSINRILNCLGNGTANQQLRMNAGATAPEWFTPSVSTTVPFTYTFIPGACQVTTAVSGLSLPATDPAVTACVTGTNTQYGVAQYADSSNLSVQGHFSLASDWTGAIDINGKWRTSATSGNVVWQVATICVADAETGDPAFNAASTVTEAAKGTTLQWNDFTLSSITITGCAANEELMFKFFRDSGHGSDTLAATAELISLVFTVRRAL